MNVAPNLESGGTRGPRAIVDDLPAAEPRKTLRRIREVCFMMMAALAWPAPAQEIVWQFRTGGSVYSSPAIDGRTAFVGSSDGKLYAIDASSGRARWAFRTGGAVDSSPAVANGTVYFLSRDGVAYAVDATTGRQKWRFETRGEKRADEWDYYLSDPTVHDKFVIFGSGDGNIYALDRASGREQWRFRTGGIVHAAPVVANGIVYVGSFDGLFYALDAKSGARRWQFDTLGAQYFPLGEVQRGAAVADGVVYFGSRDYNLYALNAATGGVHWNMRDARGWISPQPLVRANTVFVGSSDPHTVFALDAGAGSIRWQRHLNARIYGGMLATSSALVFGGFDGRLYALDPATGDIKWRYQTAASLKNEHRVYDASGNFSPEFKSLGESGRWKEAEARIEELGPIAGTPALAGDLIIFGGVDGSVYALRPPRSRPRPAKN